MSRTEIPEFKFPKVYRTEDKDGVRYEIEDQYKSDFRMSGLLWLGLYGFFFFSWFVGGADRSSQTDAAASAGPFLIGLVPFILIIRAHLKTKLHLTFDARSGRLSGVGKHIIPLASIQAFTVDAPPGVVPWSGNPNPRANCVLVYHGPNGVNRTLVVKVRDGDKNDQPRQIRAACDYCYDMVMHEARPRSAIPATNDNVDDEVAPRAGPSSDWV